MNSAAETLPHCSRPRYAVSPAGPLAPLDGELVLPEGLIDGPAAGMSMRYRLLGRTGAPVVVALGGISADRRVDEWWSELVGPGNGFDPEARRILSFDWLHRPDGRAITTCEQADALAVLLDALGIERLDALVGASYGAMVGLAFAEAHGHRLRKLVAISGAHRAHPMASARRHVQREIVRFGLEQGEPERGLALARALALTTYRPPSLFAERFGQAEPAEGLQALAGYLGHVGREFAGRFDPARFLSLSASMDLHRVDPTRVRSAVHLVAVDSDDLVPPAQMRALTGAIGLNCRLHEIRSGYGHDAFLKEPGIFNALIGRILAGEARHAVA